MKAAESSPVLEAEIERALAVLRRGGVIVYPTDTVWGIGCDATDAEAVRRVYALKRRADSKALILLVGDMASLEDIAGPLADEAGALALDAERPTTVVYPEVKGVSREVCAPDGSAAVRLTREEFSSGLCRRLGRPLVSTSANVSGEPAPRCFAEISPEILSGADHTVGYRRDDASPQQPSRIVKIETDRSITILRP